jgi:hypothetical protein
MKTTSYFIFNIQGMVLATLLAFSHSLLMVTHSHFTNMETEVQRG